MPFQLIYNHTSSLDKPSSVKRTNSVNNHFLEVVETILVTPRRRYYVVHSSLKVAVFRLSKLSVDVACSLYPSRSSSLGLGARFLI